MIILIIVDPQRTMTTNQKIEEAKFFLDHIKFYEPDVSIVKYYFSAYLAAVQSISDYILNEANLVFELGLSKNEKWTYVQFEKNAKITFEKGSKNALRYYKWWSQMISSTNASPVGKAFRNIRNIDMHKTKQKPIFNVLVLPKDNFDDEKPHKIIVEVTTGGDITSLDDLLLNVGKQHHLDKFNEIRIQKNRSLATDLKFTPYLQIEGLPNFGSLVDACDIWIQVMEQIVKISREMFQEHKQGSLIKTGLED